MGAKARKAERHGMRGLRVLRKGEGMIATRPGMPRLDARKLPVVRRRSSYDTVSERKLVIIVGIAILLGWLLATIVMLL